MRVLHRWFKTFGFTLSLYSLFVTSTENEDDSGGWYTSEKDMLAFPGPCDIEVREASGLSQQEFLNRYAYERPVVIRGATDNTIFQDECRKDVMLSNHASKRIRLSSANTHSYDKADVTLEYYVNHVMKPQSLEKLGNETFYWFGDNNFTEWESLINLYKPPPYFLPKMTGAYSFGLAGAGTGVPFHFHGPGFGEVVFGRKRWFMYPPDKTPHFHPNRTTLQWLHEDYPELHPLELPLECTLNKGDVSRVQQIAFAKPGYPGLFVEPQKATQVMTKQR